MDTKTLVGLTEHVSLRGPRGARRLTARIDTGATRSSIDAELARDLGLTEPHKHTRVRSAHGETVRPVVKASLRIAGRDLRVFFTLADRATMRYKVLIGRNVLRRNFLIDPAHERRDS